MDNLYDHQLFIDPLTSAIFPTMKQCARCLKEKPLSDFNTCHKSKDGKQSYCRDCQAAYQLTHKYDLSQEAFDKICLEQAWLCFLCNKTCEQYTKLSVDHCDILGVRKLLCMKCIGFIKSFSYNPVLIDKAIEYIRTNHKLPHVHLLIQETWDVPESNTTTYIEQHGRRQKWCPQCGVYKSVYDDFYAYQGESGHIESHSWCIPCVENARLLHTYGINLDTRDHWELLQEHRCLICEAQRPLDVDHDHKETKKTRALLCPSCNMGLGFYQDDTDLMRRAAEYLEGYILPFLARYLPLGDEMIEEVEQAVDYGQVFLV